MNKNNLEYNKKLARIFLDKPELVIEYPDWMLSDRQVEAYRQLKHMAIVEIAGRDSVVAAVKSVEEKGFTDLIPVYAYTGTEYGAWRSVEQAVQRLSSRLPTVCIHPLLLIGSPEFWRMLNGRYMSEMISRYHLFSPCPGCHLYLHVIRIPLAKKLGNIPIISGERELHNGQVKINQTGNALDAYLDFANRFGIRLLFPLRTIKQSKEIENILQIPWEMDQEQLACTFSGNYRLNNGSVGLSLNEVDRFFAEYAIPAAEEIIEAYLKGNIPDVSEITQRILDMR